MLAGKNGSLFVMFYQFLQGGKLTLADAIHIVFHLYFEMLVLALSFQRHREVVWLKRKKGKGLENITNDRTLLSYIIQHQYYEIQLSRILLMTSEAEKSHFLFNFSTTGPCTYPHHFQTPLLSNLSDLFLRAFEVSESRSAIPCIIGY